MQIDTTILASIIALFGTLITVYIGYQQWKVQRATNLSSPFLEERFKIYKKLWGLLPESKSLFEGDFDLALSHTVTIKQLTERKENIRLFIQKNEIYIEEADKQLAFQYLENLMILKQLQIEFDPKKESLPTTDKNIMWLMINRVFSVLSPKLSLKNREKLALIIHKLYGKYLIFTADIIGKALGLFDKSLNKAGTLAFQISYLCVILSLRLYPESDMKYYLKYVRRLAACANEVRLSRKRLATSIKQVISGRA